MSKIKLTKGELKRQRDALRQYQRYLPTLQLKKQQLQLEILRHLAFLEEKEHYESLRRKAIEVWAGLFSDLTIDIRQWITPKEVVIGLKNTAGADVPVFQSAEFIQPEYDLFIMPLWLDHGIEALRQLISIKEEISVIKRAIDILRHELRVTTQRVNLFEKIKIPQAEEAIRRIKIYIGDQLANSVGRSKIAKRKIEESVEALV
jgi:V/A-type H+-transporting ATPase subunit D